MTPWKGSGRKTSGRFDPERRTALNESNPDQSQILSHFFLPQLGSWKTQLCDVALRHFVTAYQRVQPLTIGELWAVVIRLCIVLVESLRGIAIVLFAPRRCRKPGKPPESGIASWGSADYSRCRQAP
jgi:hypothetical protein